MFLENHKQHLKVTELNSVINFKSEPLQKQELYQGIRKLHFLSTDFFFFFNHALKRSCVCTTVTDSTLKDLGSAYLHPALNSGSRHPTKFSVFNAPKKQFVYPGKIHCPPPLEIAETPPKENFLNPNLSASIQIVTLDILKKVWDNLSCPLHIFCISMVVTLMTCKGFEFKFSYFLIFNEQ